MANSHKNCGEPPGERLILALFRMTKAINLYHASNPRLFTIIDAIRETLEEIRAEAGPSVTLRMNNSRFYLNRQLLSLSPAATGPAVNLADYLLARRVQGFRFPRTNKLRDEQIADFIALLNHAAQEKEPIAWLQSKLVSEGHDWVEVLIDQDSELVSREEDGEAKDTGENAPQHGRKNQSLSAPAREAYSQALTMMLGMMGKLPTLKRVGVQRMKRVIQNIIDILSEDESILLGLGTIRDYDDYTYTHSVNVAILSMCLGKHIGLPRASIERLGFCGLFHDLGKIDIPIRLISKRTRLTPEEYEQVKKHPMHSLRRIMRLNVEHDMKAKFLLPPFEHHLGVDLSGYPRTSRREPLSLAGRILTIADHYDALTSNRAYRAEPFSPDMALRIMVEESGTKLDPVLLKAFIAMIGVYPVGSYLLLDTGEFGLVAEVSGANELGRPIVTLLQRNGDRFIMGDQVDLTERSEDGVGFKRNIVSCFHPSKYGIQPANFLV